MWWTQYLAVHEHVVCSEGSVHHTVFVHKLQTFKDLIGYLQHPLGANTNTKLCVGENIFNNLYAQ